MADTTTDTEVVFDLDARRAEYADDARKVRLDGEVWELPPRFPIYALQVLSEGKVDECIGMLFGADAISRLAPLFNSDDLEYLLREVYDMDDDAAEGVNRAARRSNGKKSGK